MARVIIETHFVQGQVGFVSSANTREIEITQWKMRAYDFYSRVEFSDTTQRVNEKSCKIFSMV